MDATELRLPALLSQALVAFVVEFDNAFEQRMPHRTTAHGATGHRVQAPWLVSMAMWAGCMRLVPSEGIAAAELTRLAGSSPKSMEMLVRRMSGWWGYLAVEADPGRRRADWRIRPTAAGLRAQAVWEPLTSEIEERWERRFGFEELAALRAGLAAAVGEDLLELPGFLPVGDVLAASRGASDRVASSWDATVPALMSRLLLALALDFEPRSRLALGIPGTATACGRLAVSANLLRVLEGEGLSVRLIPRRTGVAKVAVANWLRALERRGYVTVGPAGSGRERAARLTPRGESARRDYLRWADAVEREWEPSRPTLRTLRQPLARLGLATLFEGVASPEGGWRAELPPAETLPHFPVVTMRGGFPDGS